MYTCEAAGWSPHCSAALFTRDAKTTIQPISREHPSIVPATGRPIHPCRRSVRVSIAPSRSKANVSETPSSVARCLIVSGLVRRISASRLRPMPVSGCCRISASSDGVKFFVRCALCIPCMMTSRRGGDLTPWSLAGEKRLGLAGDSGVIR